MTTRIDIRFDVGVAPRRVFEALTDSEELEGWFAEKAAVSEEDERYDFWGRFTPGAPRFEEGRNPLRRFEPARELGFDWRLRGETTSVRMLLTPAKGGTSLQLHHPVPARAYTELSLGDFWMLSIENLRRRVEDGAPAVRCDYSESPRGNVQLAVDIDADRHSVYQALIEPEKVDRWMMASSTIEPVRGGRYSYGWEGDGPVEILEIAPDEKLSASWRHGGEPPTVVTWNLEGSGGRTRLLLVHSGFAPDRPTEDYRTGWMKHVVWLRSMLEKGDGWKGPEIASFDTDEVAERC